MLLLAFGAFAWTPAAAAHNGDGIPEFEDSTELGAASRALCSAAPGTRGHSWPAALLLTLAASVAVRIRGRSKSGRRVHAGGAVHLRHDRRFTGHDSARAAAEQTGAAAANAVIASQPDPMPAHRMAPSGTFTIALPSALRATPAASTGVGIGEPFARVSDPVQQAAHTVGTAIELKTPLSPESRGAAALAHDSSAAATAEAPSEQPRSPRQRSTLEFLNDVDAVAPSISREIDLDDEPELADRLGRANHAVLARGVEALPEPAAPVEARSPQLQPAPLQARTRGVAARGARVQSTAQVAPKPSRSLPGGAQSSATIDERLVSFADQGAPKAPGQLHHERIRVTVARIHSCRDALQLLGALDIQAEERKVVARMFMQINQALGRGRDETSLIKEPQAALRGARVQQLDQIERVLATLEDKVLALDEQVSRDTFSRIEAGQHSDKVLARYARLLASRPFTSRLRRSRFEWIATHLLTSVDQSGMRHIVPPLRARAVLDIMLDGLSRTGKREELADSLSYLKDAFHRLDQFATVENFLESGFFIELHARKAAMAAQLVEPEFIYLSIAVGAKLQNRLEIWIRRIEHLCKSQRVDGKASPRGRIMGWLRDQEECIDSVIATRHRGVSAARTSPSPRIAPAVEIGKVLQGNAKPRWKMPSFHIVFDRGSIAVLASLLVIAGTTLFLLFQTGSVGRPELRALQQHELAQISTLLVRGWLKGSDGERMLDAVASAGWEKLPPRERTEAAGRMSRMLAKSGIQHARIVSVGGTTLIEIEGAYVMFVQGGKL